MAGSSPSEDFHPVRIAAAVVAGLLVAGLLAAGGWAWNAARSEDASSLVGGCERFTVYAQNRWEPLGAAVRAGPNGQADQVGNYDPNQLIPVDGWVRTRAPYPSNTPPWNSDVWFHVADESGWVSFAGVRADATSPDPSGHDPDGGRPAPTDPDCSGSVR